MRPRRACAPNAKSPTPRAAQRCIDESQNKQEEEDDLLACLCELFHSISTQRKRCGVHPPRRFVAKLRAENEVFNNQMHQDAHELLNYLLNEMGEILEKRNKRAAEKVAAANGGADDSPEQGDEAGSSSSSGGGETAYVPKTWIHNIFEGLLTNETRCLACDSVTSRDESFLDLSLEIEQNSSVSACMRKFSANESLRGDNKFFCDTCCSLQEAHKRMRIKRLPNVLALHLKRFKYIEQLQRFKKLSYRIAFPIDLKLTNVCDEAVDPDRKYKLFAVIVHAVSDRSLAGLASSRISNATLAALSVRVRSRIRARGRIMATTLRWCAFISSGCASTTTLSSPSMRRRCRHTLATR